MKNILNFKLKSIQLLNTFALIALLMVIYPIALISLALINEYNIINRENIYPARFHIFNSNVYIGIALTIQVIYSVIVAPVLEEFTFRYWLDKEKSKSKHQVEAVKRSMVEQ